MLSHIRSAAFAAIVMVSGLTSIGRADHRHSMGHNHGSVHSHSHNYGHSHGYGGSGYGSGFGGSGLRLYIGPGYGSNYGYGGYGNSYYGGSRSYSPSYSTPTYVQPSYQYVQPSYQYVAPSIGNYTVTQPIRSLPPTPTFDGGPIVLTNPAANDKPVEYSVNGSRFVIKPGQSQKFVHDREWIVEFDRGQNFGSAQYSLKATNYKFKPTAQGWELFESAGSVAPRGNAPAPPENDPAANGPANLGAPVPGPDLSEKPGILNIPRVATESGEQTVPKRKLPSPPEPSSDLGNTPPKSGPAF